MQFWQFAGDDMHEIEVGKGIAKVTLTAPGADYDGRGGAALSTIPGPHVREPAEPAPDPRESLIAARCRQPLER